MKKILLIIAITVVLIFIMFQTVAAYSTIDIGSPAINRTATKDAGITWVNKANPANAAGVITSIEIWAYENLSNVEVATFYMIDTNDYSTRDTHFIGSVTGGSKQTFTGLNITVEIGDLIGYYCTDGRIDSVGIGEAGVFKRVGDNIPCVNEYFSTDVGDTMSLYGIGETVPNQVTGVSATDGNYTDKVRVTWNVASGATGYDVWTGSSWVDVGNVLTHDHTEAPAPTITVGTASASDGTSTDHVTLSIAGESANVGSSISYKVRAYNAIGDGAESASNSGYRGVGALTYQWQRSSGDADADYSNIDGATTDPYNDTGAPANGDGRYYKCIENATGATQVTTNADRGYRDVVVGILWNGITITKWNGITITKINGK